ncbi:putative c6 transcription factor protein [Botrytis fragariae]|uniref:Putative c6 transcription factor protein n=1 Tax=Botrytis fragariae TaxID=1964551 RepID=A0A8H6EEG3_9HELO|nr:putative c6 transcription factor protein [Botrytis fragariae]KAF5869133.1 putative c6 transcription factor protein [Botrytis fragariae]
MQELLKHARRKQWDPECVAVLEEQNSTLRAQVAQLQADQASSLTSSENPSGTLSLANTTKAPSLPSHQANVLVGEQRNTARTELPLFSSAINDIATLVWRLDLGDKGEPMFSRPSGNFCIPSSADAAVARSEARKRPQVFNNMMPIYDACYNLSLKMNLMNLFLTQLNPEERNAGKEFEECMDMNSVKACREQPSLPVVQALSIIAWRELRQEHNSCASLYISMAGGLAMGLSLHAIGLGALSKSDTSKRLLEQEQENRLRTFWSLFFIDRTAATMLGISCVVPWLLVSISTAASIPPRSALFLQMSYQMSLLMIHRPYLGDPPASDSFSLAFATIASAAIRMTQYIHLFRKSYLAEPTCTLPSLGNDKQDKPTAALPFIVHHILTASIVHHLFRTSRTPTQISLARRRLQICMETLTALQNDNSIQNCSDTTQHSTVNPSEKFDTNTILTSEVIAGSHDDICDPHTFLPYVTDSAQELDPDLYTAAFSTEDGDELWMGQLDFMLNENANSSSLWRDSSPFPGVLSPAREFDFGRGIFDVPDLQTHDSAQMG